MSIAANEESPDAPGFLHFQSRFRSTSRADHPASEMGS